MLLTDEDDKKLRPATIDWLVASTVTTHAHIFGGEVAISGEVMDAVDVILTGR